MKIAIVVEAIWVINDEAVAKLAEGQGKQQPPRRKGLTEECLRRGTRDWSTMTNDPCNNGSRADDGDPRDLIGDQIDRPMQTCASRSILKFLKAPLIEWSHFSRMSCAECFSEYVRMFRNISSIEMVRNI